MLFLELFIGYRTRHSGFCKIIKNALKHHSSGRLYEHAILKCDLLLGDVTHILLLISLRLIIERRELDRCQVLQPQIPPTDWAWRALAGFVYLLLLCSRREVGQPEARPFQLLPLLGLALRISHHLPGFVGLVEKCFLRCLSRGRLRLGVLPLPVHAALRRDEVFDLVRSRIGFVLRLFAGCRTLLGFPRLALPAQLLLPR
mmetsp:Transcript_27446/g.48539  ORF Transcript_27446/g.48539 Transcript_27446/m.48539 type:complete len:201 (-) Transcript_27446:212-814(-)